MLALARSHYPPLVPPAMTAAAALPPPTSPYLQALERASSGIVKQQAAAASNLYGYEDESDGCWVYVCSPRQSCSNADCCASPLPHARSAHSLPFCDILPCTHTGQLHCTACTTAAATRQEHLKHTVLRPAETQTPCKGP